MSHIWMSHVTHIDNWVMSHIQRNLVSHMHESCHTYSWVMSHTYKRIMSHTCRSHVTHTHESCLTYLESYLTWVMCDTHHRWWHTLSHVSHIRSRFSHTNESCLTYEGVMSHIQTNYFSHMESYLTWVMCDTHHRWWHTLSHVSHMRSRFSHTNESCVIYKWIMSHIQMSHVSHMKES